MALAHPYVFLLFLLQLAADYKAADYMASFFDMGQEDTEVTLKELEKVAPRVGP